MSDWQGNETTNMPFLAIQQRFDLRYERENIIVMGLHNMLNGKPDSDSICEIQN